MVHKVVTVDQDQMEDLDPLACEAKQAQEDSQEQGEVLDQMEEQEVMVDLGLMEDEVQMVDREDQDL